MGVMLTWFLVTVMEKFFLGKPHRVKAQQARSDDEALTAESIRNRWTIIQYDPERMTLLSSCSTSNPDRLAKWGEHLWLAVLGRDQCLG